MREWIQSLGIEGMGALLRQMLTLVASALYFGAFATSLLKKDGFHRLSAGLWIGGVCVNAVIVLNNWIVNGYMPFVSMYQVLTFLGVTYSLVYLYVRYMHEGAFMKPYFIVFQGVLMLGVFFMGRTATEWSFPPALQSVYFIPHVFSYMISYTLIAVAALLVVISCFSKKARIGKLENGAYQLVLTGFPFMVLGMLLGALWANACWGHFWTWDHKESWSLVTVMSLAVYLHFRRHACLQKYAKYFVVLAFLLEIVTLFFVGMLGGESMHAYS